MKVTVILLLYLMFAVNGKAQVIYKKDSIAKDDIEYPFKELPEPVATPNEIYVNPEQQPTFPGGDENLKSFIAKNLKWPKSDPEFEVRGKVYLQFVVEKSGRLTHYNILRSPYQGFGEEAIRVMKKSPKWIPGKIRNKPVRCYYTIPVSFQIED